MLRYTVEFSLIESNTREIEKRRFIVNAIDGEDAVKIAITKFNQTEESKRRIQVGDCAITINQNDFVSYYIVDVGFIRKAEKREFDLWEKFGCNNPNKLLGIEAALLNYL